MRLGHALFGEADVLPTGEAVEPVPLALAVADENEHVVPDGGLFAVRTFRHGLSRCSTRSRSSRMAGYRENVKFGLTMTSVSGSFPAPGSRLLGKSTSFCQIQASRRPAGSQAKHILHREKAGTAPARPQRRLDRAARENAAVGGDMGKLDPFARSGEDHPVLSHHVAAAQRGKADIAFAPRPGLAVAGAHAPLFERNLASLGGGPAEHQRRARGRVALVPVVHFKDLDVELGSERF